MKTQTKLKIIHWVEKLLKYDRTKEEGPFIVKERREIIRVVSRYAIDKGGEHLLKIEPDYYKEQVERIIGNNILEEMKRIKAIKFEWVDNSNNTGEKYAEGKTFVTE